MKTNHKAALAVVAGLAAATFATTASAEIIDFEGEQFDTASVTVLENQSACTADSATVGINIAFFPSKTDLETTGQSLTDVQAQIQSTFASQFSAAVSTLSTAEFMDQAGYTAVIQSAQNTIEQLEQSGITIVASQPGVAFMPRPGCN